MGQIDVKRQRNRSSERRVHLKRKNNEKLLITINIVLLTQLSFAQFPVLSTSSLADGTNDPNFGRKGNYAKDTNNERDQFIGLWRYDQGGILFELIIQKADKYLTEIVYNGVLLDYHYKDEVKLRYKLVKNGVTIHDNLATQITMGYVSTGTKFGTKDAVHGRFLDYTRNVIASFSIKKLPGWAPKIFFDLNPYSYTLQNPREYYEDDLPLFNVPIEGIEMVKVNGFVPLD